MDAASGVCITGRRHHHDPHGMHLAASAQRGSLHEWDTLGVSPTLHQLRKLNLYIYLNLYVPITILKSHEFKRVNMEGLGGKRVKGK